MSGTAKSAVSINRTMGGACAFSIPRNICILATLTGSDTAMGNAVRLSIRDIPDSDAQRFSVLAGAICTAGGGSSGAT